MHVKQRDISIVRLVHSIVRLVHQTNRWHSRTSVTTERTTYKVDSDGPWINRIFPFQTLSRLKRNVAEAETECWRTILEFFVLLCLDQHFFETQRSFGSVNRKKYSFRACWISTIQTDFFFNRSILQWDIGFVSLEKLWETSGCLLVQDKPFVIPSIRKGLVVLSNAVLEGTRRTWVALKSSDEQNKEQWHDTDCNNPLHSQLLGLLVNCILQRYNCIFSCCNSFLGVRPQELQNFLCQIWWFSDFKFYRHVVYLVNQAYCITHRVSNNFNYQF